jgi:hypothetical protein
MISPTARRLRVDNQDDRPRRFDAVTAPGRIGRRSPALMKSKFDFRLVCISRALILEPL